jgi:alcohol dehydrogenase
MQAVFYEQFGGPITLRSLPDPSPPPDGVVLRVAATGLCRSDWHGWMGHDPDISLPHVPGHELAGEVVAVGNEVRRWRGGERVTLPFVCACGLCPQCLAGQQQVCEAQFQPGFTHWGSFAEYVAIGRADLNLVGLPADLDELTAASLGCRFATAFRALVDQARLSGGQWLAVFGCGGVGLSALLIAKALGASVLAIDISPEKLALARRLGADAAIDASSQPQLVEQVRQLTGGGAHVSLDALGSPQTCCDAIACLRRRGRHVQVGLLPGVLGQPAVPMSRVIALELEIYGSHGMPAHRYPALLEMIRSGQLAPQRLVGRVIGLEQAPAALAEMGAFPGVGLTVIKM